MQKHETLQSALQEMQNWPLINKKTKTLLQSHDTKKKLHRTLFYVSMKHLQKSNKSLRATCMSLATLESLIRKDASIKKLFFQKKYKKQLENSVTRQTIKFIENAHTQPEDALSAALIVYDSNKQISLEKIEIFRAIQKKLYT